MIGESAGSVYISIFGDNRRLANDLKQTDSLIRRHAAAMAGLKLFQPGLFSQQLSSFQAMAKGSAILGSQLNMMAGLAPKLGALAAPFVAMRNAMTSFRTVVNPGVVVSQAMAGQVKALEAAHKMQAELKKRIGYTPSQAADAKQGYQEDVDKAAAKVERATVRVQKALENENTTIAKQTAAEVKLKTATDALTEAKEKQAAEIKKIDSQIKGNAISGAEAKARLAPYVKAVHDAHAQVKAAQGTSKLDIMGGGAVSGIMNLISGVVSGFKLIFGVVSTVFSVLKSIASVAISVAETIIHTIGSAFSFIGSVAKRVFQVVSVAAMAVGTALVAGLRSVFERGNALLNAFAQTGVRVRDALVIGTAASMTGVDKENIATQINRMQRSISGIDKEGPKIKDALAGLGVDLARLQALRPVDQLTALADGLAKVKDPAQRAGIAINIFSVRGSQMISLLLQMAEAIKLSKQQWGLAADAMDKNKDKFAYIARSIEGITQVKIPSFFAGIATPLANTLSWLSDKLNAFDPFKTGVKIGAKIDEYLRLIIGAFQKGRLMEWLGLELKVAFLDAVNYLIAGLMIAGKAISGIFKIEGLFKALGDGIAGAFLYGVGIFLEAFGGILPDLAEWLGKLFGTSLSAVKNYIGNQGDEKIKDSKQENISGLKDQEVSILSKQLATPEYKRDLELKKSGKMSHEEGAAKFQSGAYLSGWDRGGLKDIRRDIAAEEKDMSDAQKRLDDRKVEQAASANKYGQQARAAAAGWVSPDNYTALQSKGQTLMTTAGTSLIAMMPQVMGAVTNAVSTELSQPRQHAQTNYDAAVNFWMQKKQDRLNAPASDPAAVAAADSHLADARTLVDRTYAILKNTPQSSVTDRMLTAPFKAQLDVLRGQLTLPPVTGTGGKQFNADVEPPSGRAGVVAATASTMSGFAAGRIGHFGKSREKMEKSLDNIDKNTKGLKNGGYAQ